jgi:TolB-like protein
MKKSLTTLLLFVHLHNANAQTTYEKQIRDITTELGKKIAETDKKRVAVADFTDLDGTVTKLGRFIAEEFNTYLPEAGHGLEVIDRSRINVLIKENQMLRKGLTDPSAAAKLGQLAGVNALVFGTLTTFGESVRLNIKILDIQRGVVIRSMIGNITRTADINKLLSELSSTDTNTEIDTDTNPKPLSTGDCKTKNICVVCVTNQSTQDIITILYNSKRTNKELLINPNSKECWKEVSIKSGEDFEDMKWIVKSDGRVVVNEIIPVESCKTYNKTYQK